MVVLRWFALLCTLVLGGCFTTKDEPFSLTTGDMLLPADMTRLSCTSYNKDGEISRDEKGNVIVAENQLILLQSNKKNQYVFVDKNISRTQPLTFHGVGEGVYVVAAASLSAPGEILYVAQVSSTKFTMFAYGDDVKGHAQELAHKHHVVIKPDKGYWDLSGPVSNQKRFLLDMVSDLASWRMFTDCTIETKNAD